MGQLRTLESDELILLNSEEPHRVMSDEIHRRSHHIVLHLSYEYAEEYDKNMESIYFELNPHAAKKLKPLLLELVRLTYNRHHDPYADMEKKAVVIKIYHELLVSCRVEKNVRLYHGSNDNLGKIKTVIEYLDEHYQEDITRDDMATLVGLSPAYFSHHFKTVTEMTFVRFLSCLRMEHALSDLVSMDISVTDAALRNGFANVRAFSASCKRVFGLTPMQLKKNRRRSILP